MTAIQCRAREVKSPHPHVFGGAYAEYFCAAARQRPLQHADGCADFRSAGRSVGVFSQGIFEQIYDVLVSSPRPRVLEGARCQTVDECFEEIAFKRIDCLLTCNGARPVLGELAPPPMEPPQSRGRRSGWFQDRTGRGQSEVRSTKSFEPASILSVVLSSLSCWLRGSIDRGDHLAHELRSCAIP